MCKGKEKNKCCEENRQPISLRRGWEAAAPSCREVLALHLKEVAHPLADLLPSPLPSPVLDLACGPGTAMAAFASCRDPGTGRGEIANRTPLFLLSRRRG